MYTRMGWVIRKKKVLHLRRQILAQNSAIVLKGGVDSNFKAIYCVRPEKFTIELEAALDGACPKVSGSQLAEAWRVSATLLGKR